MRSVQETHSHLQRSLFTRFLPWNQRLSFLFVASEKAWLSKEPRVVQLFDTTIEEAEVQVKVLALVIRMILSSSHTK